MAQYLIVIAFFAVAVVLMGLSLKFSKYKQGNSGCCGGGHCDTDGNHEPHSCYNEKLKFVKEYKK